MTPRPGNDFDVLLDAGTGTERGNMQNENSAGRTVVVPVSHVVVPDVALKTMLTLHACAAVLLGLDIAIFTPDSEAWARFTQYIYWPSSWGLLMVGFGVLVGAGMRFNKARVTAIGIYGAAAWYSTQAAMFAVSALHYGTAHYPTIVYSLLGILLVSHAYWLKSHDEWKK